VTEPGSGVVESSGTIFFFFIFGGAAPFALAFSFTGHECGLPPVKCADPSNEKPLCELSATTLVTVVLAEHPFGLGTLMLEVDPGVVWTLGLDI
jgi:hypothetical protein